jgi:glycosyltransferase involved in cell wall biosynthesis
MKISVVGPVKNEAQFIGYSIMAILPYIHEIIYACAKSTDGTDELLDYIKETHAGDKLTILRKPEYDFDPHDMGAYNQSFNDCIQKADGDAVWFLHPDMIVTNPESLPNVPAGAAWYTTLTSYAKDFKTKIAQGRALRWKNMHIKRFGLHYYGEYGSQNEDFYFGDITGEKHEHFGEAFGRYPFRVRDSGIKVNHYCELKDFSRRYEKMKTCLETLYPKSDPEAIKELALAHPRVTLEKTSDLFGNFIFAEANDPIPTIFEKHKEYWGFQHEG